MTQWISGKIFPQQHINEIVIESGTEQFPTFIKQRRLLCLRLSADPRNDRLGCSSFWKRCTM